MRDPKRIEWMMWAVKRAWKRYPDLRLGQLILNLAQEDEFETLYNLEDDALMARIEKLYK
jgi:uncharacterized protein YihD (DUF1040 family)